MPTARPNASALCNKQAADVILVVGGCSRQDSNFAELLHIDAHQSGQTWRWRVLTPMHEARVKPGMLLLPGSEEIQCVVVVGGY